MAKHSACRTGGPCRAVVTAHSVEALAEVLRDCSRAGWPYRLVGATTRTAFRDGPCGAVVLRLGTGFANIQDVGGGVIRVGAAVPMPALLVYAASLGYTGLEPFAAVPGSVGASILSDTGWDSLVQTVDHFHRRRPRTCLLDEVRGRSRIYLGFTIGLRVDTVARATRSLGRAARSARPRGWFAATKRGRVREALTSAQLTRVRLRSAEIPAQAPELMINRGGALGSDMALLHKSAIERVRAVRGIELASAIQWVGDRAAKQEDEIW